MLMMRKEIGPRIIVDPRVMTGKPVIKGTRITVELVLRQLAQGIAVKDILENYPHLTKKDILAAISYAAQLVKEEEVYPLPPKTHGRVKTLV